VPRTLGFTLSPCTHRIGASGPSDSAASDHCVEEVVVTAQRRVEELQKRTNPRRPCHWRICWRRKRAGPFALQYADPSLTSGRLRIRKRSTSCIGRSAVDIELDLGRRSAIAIGPYHFPGFPKRAYFDMRETEVVVLRGSPGNVRREGVRGASGIYSFDRAPDLSGL